MSFEVSVIVPVYNAALYLTEALESAWRQTHPPHEIIVVDDGSTDDTAQVVSRFDSQFGAGIRYCFQQNRGTGAARNRGAQMATGDYLAFLDDDDIWLAQKLMRQQRAMASDPELDAVFGLVEECRGKLVEGGGPPIPGFIPSTLLVRSDAFWQVGPFGTQWLIGEWADWYVRALELRLNLLVIPEVMARRRIHDSNKGILYSQARVEYTRVLRASLQRRRAARGEQAAP